MKLLPAVALVALALSTPAAGAQAASLLDYRDSAFLAGSAYYSQVERRAVAEALRTAPNGLADELGESFVILGDAGGAFTAPGKNERIYLVQKRAPLAIQSFADGPPPVLVVLDHGKPGGVYRLADDVQYQRLVAAADGNGDGRDDILLETSFMNMGHIIVAIDAVALQDDGTAKVWQTLSDVYTDACDNPAGERSRRAATVSVGQREFVSTQHELGCTP